MEEKSNLSVIQSLIGTKLSVLETVELNNKGIKFWAKSDKSGSLESVNKKELAHLKTELLNWIDEKAMKSKLSEKVQQKVCYSYLRDSRKICGAGEVKDLCYKKPFVFGNLVLQKYVGNINSDESSLLLRIVLVHKKYNSQIFKRTFNGKLTKVKKGLYLNTLIDMAKVIITCVEQNETQKKIVHIDIEFIEDLNGNHWVQFIHACRTINKKSIMNFSISCYEDIENYLKTGKRTRVVSFSLNKHNLKKRDITHSGPELKKRTVPPQSKMRIYSPQESEEEINSPVKQNSRNSRRSSTHAIKSADHSFANFSLTRSKTDIREGIIKFAQQSVTQKPQEPQEPFSRDFMELVIRTYCKKSKIQLPFISQKDFGVGSMVTYKQFVDFFKIAQSPSEAKHLSIENSPKSTEDSTHNSRRRLRRVKT